MRSDRNEITDEIRDKLRYEKNRTKLGGRALLRGKRGQLPDGLSGSMIDKWRSGSIASAKPTHLEWVLREYEAWTPPPLPDAPTKMMLTDELRAFIQNEAKRTGLGAVAILRHVPKPIPEGLNQQKIQRWLSGKTRRAEEEHWNLVMAAYAQIMDRSFDKAR